MRREEFLDMWYSIIIDILDDNGTEYDEIIDNYKFDYILVKGVMKQLGVESLDEVDFKIMQMKMGV